MFTPTIILLVDLERDLACRIVAALRKAGHRPLRVTGTAETARAVEQLGDALGLVITGGAEAGTVLGRIAPRIKVLNITEAGLDIARLPDDDWIHLVRAVLDEPR